MTPQEMKIGARSAALVVVDWQERLFPAMEEARRDFALRSVRILMEAASLTGMPTLVTEQYPKGLGHTLPELKALLAPQNEPIAKTCFSCADSDFFMTRLKALDREVIVLAGMETHVCVWQTARDLRVRGYTVHAVSDAVLSRTDENRQIGLSLMREAGCVITAAEVVAFDLVRGADHPSFKAVSKLVR